MSNRYGVFTFPRGRVRGGHRCVLGEGVNLSMSPQCSLSYRQLSGSHRSLTSSVLQAGVSPEPQLTIITLQPLKLSCLCRTSLASHDWLFDRWCHVMLARGCHLQIRTFSPLCTVCDINAVSKHIKDVSLFSNLQRSLLLHERWAITLTCRGEVEAGGCYSSHRRFVLLFEHPCASSPKLDYHAETMRNCPSVPDLQVSLELQCLCKFPNSSRCLYPWNWKSVFLTVCICVSHRTVTERMCSNGKQWRLQWQW